VNGGSIDVSSELPSALEIALRNRTALAGQKGIFFYLSNIFLRAATARGIQILHPLEMWADFSLYNTKQPDSDV